MTDWLRKQDEVEERVKAKMEEERLNREKIEAFAAKDLEVGAEERRELWKREEEEREAQVERERHARAREVILAVFHTLPSQQH